MPGLAKKLIVFAAVDGLFLQPIGLRGSSLDNGGVRIEYGTNRITTVSSKHESTERGLETHGIVGLLNLVTSSYLISITRREEVAKIRGKPIWRVTDVCLIPLKSKEEAEKAIDAAQKSLKQSGGDYTAKAEETEDEDGADDASTIASVDDHEQGPDHQREPEDEAAALEPTKAGVVQKSTTFVKNVVQDRGKFGRLAGKWFSRKPGGAVPKNQEGVENASQGAEDLTKEQEKQAQQALPEDDHEDASVGAENNNKGHNVDAVSKEQGLSGIQQQTAIESLTPRILKSARLYFSSSGFYFSYEHDLSRQSQVTSSLPLWKRFERLYFWNHHLLKPFIDAGQDSLVLPLMQGFVGQRSFSIAKTEETENDIVAETTEDGKNTTNTQEPNTETETPEKGMSTHDLFLTLISRRSIKRAGLRYLRRGIDDEGSVANNVETEQVLSFQSRSDSEKTFSLLQVRGSIPIFFSQSPYSFKPVPVMFGSESTNHTAFKKHLQNMKHRYGDVQIACLVDKHATEAAIGEAFEKHTKQINEQGELGGNEIGWEWFDFHSQCKGMKFENVQILMDTLQDRLTKFGWLLKQNDMDIRQQTGVLRTNCMDCLDRTNVVQSAVAGWALQQQLAELGLNIDLKTDPKTQWFNTLWADNGDAISKQYAGTSALKGDFTRTRKRNWTGALSDFSLTLTRYYNNIFADYFLQTNIDYWLGNAGPNIFEEFETDMTSQDYALDMRHVRQNAIDACVKIVLGDETEGLRAGWTLSTPGQSNTLRALPFEECVLLLTSRALYFCRFDWETEKVGSFEEVELVHIKEIWRGAYITSALGQIHLDEAKNRGFVIRFQAEGEGLVRRNTRSLSVVEEKETETETEKEHTTDEEAHLETRILAFKALPPKAFVSRQDQDSNDVDEGEMVRRITDAISKTASEAFTRERGFQHIEVEKSPVVQEHDIISVTEAKRGTGYLESLSYGFKRLVWS